MPRTCRHPIAALALAVMAGVAATTAHAGPELMDVDTRFRAKIAKEKIRIAARERDVAAKAKGKTTAPGGNCGSQSIGNIDTGGRIGAAPREVFVFAPNAINIVGRGGCR